MLSTANSADERVSAAHRAKLAYVYVRQSSVNQVRQHQESTELQYRLVDRAVGLGWPRERVHVIDEDRLRGLTASALDDLHRDGHLLPIFMALASQGNLPALIARKNATLAHG